MKQICFYYRYDRNSFGRLVSYPVAWSWREYASEDIPFAFDAAATVDVTDDELRFIERTIPYYSFRY